MKTSTYFGYSIPYKGFTTVTDEADPEDSWSSDSTHTDWWVESKISFNEKNNDIAVPFKLQKDKQYYLVYFIYSTGCSFNNESGYAIQFVEIFEDINKAKELEKLILENAKIYKSNENLGESIYSLKYNDEVGNVKTLSCEWNGYFNSLDEVTVLPITLFSK